MPSTPRVCCTQSLRYVVLSALVPFTNACCSLPRYEPAYWNDGATVQSQNNCYNYGTNKRTDTFAQPGRRAGAMYTAITCDEVRRGALADGLSLVPGSGDCGTQCRVALVVGEIYPGLRDYHWYRRDEGGMWSHKPGGGSARNVDNSGHLISDPATADRDGYTEFCGYLCTCSSDVQGQGGANIN